MFTDEASLFPVIDDGLACGARRQITALGGGLLLTDYALFYRHDTKHNLGNSAQRVKLMCFKKPLKSDFEKRENPIHNTRYQTPSKDKASKTQPT